MTTINGLSLSVFDLDSHSSVRCSLPPSPSLLRSLYIFVYVPSWLPLNLSLQLSFPSPLLLFLLSFFFPSSLPRPSLLPPFVSPPFLVCFSLRPDFLKMLTLLSSLFVAFHHFPHALPSPLHSSLLFPSSSSLHRHLFPIISSQFPLCILYFPHFLPTPSPSIPSFIPLRLCLPHTSTLSSPLSRRRPPSPPPRARIDWVLTASLGFCLSPCWMQPRGSDPAGGSREKHAPVTCQLFPHFTFSGLTFAYLLIPGCWKCASRMFPPHPPLRPGVYCHEDVSQANWRWRLHLGVCAHGCVCVCARWMCFASIVLQVQRFLFSLFPLVCSSFTTWPFDPDAFAKTGICKSKVKRLLLKEDHARRYIYSSAALKYNFYAHMHIST